MALMPVEEALERLLASVRPMSATEIVPLREAIGRVLAGPILARRTTPAADVSAMDGYALRSADAATVPAELTLIGESAAGNPFAGEVTPGAAVRIFTGAVMPVGADAVIIQEDTRREGQKVVCTEAAVQGRHIRRAGGDFNIGEQLLPAGHKLRARDLSLIASADIAEVGVLRRPRVGLLSTGNELVRPGTGAQGHHVILSNIYPLAALAESAGAEVTDLGLLPDDRQETEKGIRAALSAGFDVLITSGGASVGDHDLVAPSLLAQGVDLAVHKIALRPGKPLMFGQSSEGVHVLGLPGNPVSAHVCALLFLIPLLETLQGQAIEPGVRLKPAILGADVPKNAQRMDFMRAETIGWKNGLRVVKPLPTQDSSMLRLLSQADILLVRPPNAPAAMAGEPCDILPLEA